MKKLLVLGLCSSFLAAAFFAEIPAKADGGGAGRGEGGATLGNGDVNGDNAFDLSDAIYLLSFLFQGGPAPKPCPVLGSPEVCDNNVDDDFDGATDCDDDDCETDPFCIEPGDASLLPDTGVTDCYNGAGNIDPECDALPGQDGSYRTGCQMLGRFTVNDGDDAMDTADDTVTDNCTGLMWQRDGLGEAVWWDALVACENLVLAGFDDWRLPNLHELASIIDYSARDPAVPQEFSDFTTLVHYHSSTFYRRASFTCTGPERVWGVTGATGGIGASGTRNIDVWNFRAVRTVIPAGGGAAQGRGAATLGNGDVNGDNALDLSDAIYLLAFLFQGGEALAPCPGGAAGGGAGLGGAPLPATGQKDCYYFEVIPPEVTDPNEVRLFQRGLLHDIDCDDVLAPGVYEDSPGQDGFYKTGCSPLGRFDDSAGDGTVTDNCTNLMWQQDTADTSGDGAITSLFSEHCCDDNNNIVVCGTPAVKRAVQEPLDGLPWHEALAYCESLVLTTGGTFKEEEPGDSIKYNDWRLPNVRELRSIVNHGTIHKAIFPEFTAVGAIPPNGDFLKFWTSTLDVSGEAKAWGVVFCAGDSQPGHLVDPCTMILARRYVRAVRTVTP